MKKKIISVVVVLAIVFATLFSVATPASASGMTNAKFELLATAIASTVSNSLAVSLADNDVIMSSHTKEFQNALFKDFSEGFSAYCSSGEKEELAAFLTGKTGSDGYPVFKPFKDVLLTGSAGNYSGVRMIKSEDEVGDYKDENGKYYYQDFYDYLVKLIGHAAVGHKDILWPSAPWSWIVPPVMDGIAQGTNMMILIPGGAIEYTANLVEDMILLYGSLDYANYHRIGTDEQIQGFAKQAAKAYKNYLGATDARKTTFCETFRDVFQKRTSSERMDILEPYLDATLKDCIAGISAEDKAQYAAQYAAFAPYWIYVSNNVAYYCTFPGTYTADTEEMKTFLSLFSLASVFSEGSDLTVLLISVTIIGAAGLVACIVAVRKKRKHVRSATT